MSKEQTLHPESADVLAEAPRSTVVTTQTPDGRWQSTVSISFQVTSTWVQPDKPLAPVAQRKPSEGDTDTGGTTKTGLGLDTRASRSSDGDTEPPGSSKGGLGVQKVDTSRPHVGD